MLLKLSADTGRDSVPHLYKAAAFPSLIYYYLPPYSHYSIPSLLPLSLRVFKPSHSCPRTIPLCSTNRLYCLTICNYRIRNKTVLSFKPYHQTSLSITPITDRHPKHTSPSLLRYPQCPHFQQSLFISSFPMPSALRGLCTPIIFKTYPTRTISHRTPSHRHFNSPSSDQKYPLLSIYSLG